MMKWEEKNILEEIYDKAVSCSEYLGDVESKINLKLETLLCAYKRMLPALEYMELQEIVVGGTVVAEKEAFIAGICYGTRLFMEILDGKGEQKQN